MALELKVPPVIVGMAVSLLMWMAARWIPILSFAGPQRGAVAIMVVAVGVAVAVAGVVAFRRARTTVNPLHPEKMSALVVAGVYRVTRNPMYLGMLLTLAGWAIWLGSLSPWVVLPGFVMYMNRFQIAPEERALAAMFGADFAGYCTRVRRWV